MQGWGISEKEEKKRGEQGVLTGNGRSGGHKTLRSAVPRSVQDNRLMPIVPDGARKRSLSPMLHTGHAALESFKARAQSNIRVKPVPLSDSAGEEGVVLISVMFADRYIPVRMCTM